MGHPARGLVKRSLVEWEMWARPPGANNTRFGLTSWGIRARLRIIIPGASRSWSTWAGLTHPMPAPESAGKSSGTSSGTSPSWHAGKDDSRVDAQGMKQSAGRVGDVVSAEHPRDVVEVARTLAAYGGGTGSFDLALDLVLNEVVEQARLLTGATGAAIALMRDGEMVCRATSGKDAPELGVRLETTSGLSGACLQTGQIQQCSDTETDGRVNAAACRQLGLRSIVVLPLGESPPGKNPFGVFEVFSSQPNVFGDRDIATLEWLARQVVENKRGAEAVPSAPSGLDSRLGGSNAGDIRSQPESEFEDADLLAQDLPTQDLPANGSARRGEIWTSILGILVVAVAVLLGLALGWHGAAGGGGRTRQQAVSAAAAERSATVRPNEGRPNDARSALDRSASATAGNSAASEASGGLVVSQNGKVIYRLPEPKAVGPSQGSGKLGKAAASRVGDSSLIENRLIHKVQPQYPADARARGVQGAVVLDLQIGGDGAVKNIAVVEGDPELADAAVEAVRQWRYRPYTVDGKAVEMQTRVTIKFTLPAN